MLSHVVDEAALLATLRRYIGLIIPGEFSGHPRANNGQQDVIGERSREQQAPWFLWKAFRTRKVKCPGWAMTFRQAFVGQTFRILPVVENGRERIPFTLCAFHLRRRHGSTAVRCARREAKTC